MAYPNAFALKTSDLNAFLFANIGTEMNGSELTMLSMLARLGQDPWAEAGRLSRMPATDALKSLIQSLGKMPLGPQAVLGISATASRLIALLPRQATMSAKAANPSVSPPWLHIALLGLMLALGVATTVTLFGKPAPTVVVGPAPFAVHGESKPADPQPPF